ncbi:MAG: MFS transporter, partial [Verrucomicrobia bacterium]|nr:MFS transporter [Verrucomicrobiota bacterium]
GILPEILPTARLVKANGSVELLTLVAILTGTIGGAVMADHLAAVVAYAAVVGIYAASLALNLFMEKTPAYPEVKLSQTLGGFAANLRFIFTGRRLARVLLGTSLFWICGALMKMNFQPWGQQVLHLASNTQISLLGLWLSVGVMIGSVLAGQLHAVGELGATRRYGWLLAAAIGLLAAVGWFMGHGLAHPQPFVIGVLAVAGVFAGLFLIPLNAALQAESHQDKLGKTIATQNCLENIAMLGGSAFAWVNVNAGVDPSQLFLGLAALVAVVVCFLKIPVAKTEAQA